MQSNKVIYSKVNLLFTAPVMRVPLGVVDWAWASPSKCVWTTTEVILVTVFNETLSSAHNPNTW